MGSVTILKYHLVLTAKYHKPVFTGIEQSVYDVLRCVEKTSDFRILDMRIEDGNCVHLVIKMSPRYSVSSMVNRITGLSQHYVWQKEEDHLKEFYQGSKKKLWHKSYFCLTLGGVSEKNVSEIIHQRG